MLNVCDDEAQQIIKNYHYYTVYPTLAISNLLAFSTIYWLQFGHLSQIWPVFGRILVIEILSGKTVFGKTVISPQFFQR